MLALLRYLLHGLGQITVTSHQYHGIIMTLESMDQKVRCDLHVDPLLYLAPAIVQLTAFGARGLLYRESVPASTATEFHVPKKQSAKPGLEIWDMAEGAIELHLALVPNRIIPLVDNRVVVISPYNLCQGIVRGLSNSLYGASYFHTP